MPGKGHAGTVWGEGNGQCAERAAGYMGEGVYHLPTLYAKEFVHVTFTRF